MAIKLHYDVVTYVNESWTSIIIRLSKDVPSLCSLYFTVSTMRRLSFLSKYSIAQHAVHD